MKWIAAIAFTFSMAVSLSTRADDSCGNPPQPVCETNDCGEVTCYDPITGEPLPGDDGGSPSPTPQPEGGCSSLS